MDFEERDRIWRNVAEPPEGWTGSKYYDGPDSHMIRYGYAPAQSDMAGTVVITHGYGENIDIYYETIKKYQNLGYDVYALDWYGQGLSGRHDPDDPTLPYAEGLDKLVPDLHHFVEKFVKRTHDDNLPLVMSTNSMGGHVGMLYLKEHPETFDGAIMSSPLLRNRFLSWSRFFWPTIKASFNLISKVGFGNWHMAKDWESLRKYEISGKNRERLKPTFRDLITSAIQRDNDTAMIGVPTFKWLVSTFNTAAQIMKSEFLRELETPTLIGSAGDDTYVDLRAHHEAYEAMPNAELITLPDATHTLWRDSEENVNAWWHYIGDFLERVSANKRGEDVNFKQRQVHDADGRPIMKHPDRVGPVGDVDLRPDLP